MSNTFKIYYPSTPSAVGDTNPPLSRKQPFTPPSFTSIWNIATNGDAITIPINTTYEYDYTIDWGDGKVDDNITSEAMHTYETSGEYTIKITGTFPTVYFDNGEDKDKIIRVLDASIFEDDISGSFYGCTNLDTFNTTGMTSVTNCDGAWENCTGLTTFNASGLTSVTSCNVAWQSCSGLKTFNASALTSVLDCNFAWDNCSGLTTFNASTLTSVRDCNYAWHRCVGVTTFNASGLTSVINCEGAWKKLFHVSNI